jgi:hypothetical protein
MQALNAMSRTTTDGCLVRLGGLLLLMLLK